MRKLVNDFILDSKGHCFLCLSRIKCPSPPTPSSSPSPSTTIHSLQYLSRHLKLDLGKVLQNQQRPLPPHLLAKVKRSRLKVELCQGCGPVVDRFSELYGQLEKLRMEVESCVSKVQETLVRSRAAGEEERFGGRVGMGDLGGLVEMVGVLRTETLQKCSKKLRSSLPRVSIPAPAAAAPSKTKTRRRALTGPGAPQAKEFVDGRFGRRDRRSSRWTLNPATGKRRCNLCPYEFNTNPAFHFHYKMAHLHIRYNCPQCGKQFPYKSSLYLHIRSIHMKVRFQCHRCHKKFTQSPQLGKHYRESDCKPPRVVKTGAKGKGKAKISSTSSSNSKGQQPSQDHHEADSDEQDNLGGGYSRAPDFDIRKVKMERFHEAIVPDDPEGEEEAPPRPPIPLGMVSAVLEGLGIM